jgi:hypothetical protein
VGEHSDAPIADCRFADRFPSWLIATPTCWGTYQVRQTFGATLLSIFCGGEEDFPFRQFSDPFPLPPLEPLLIVRVRSDGDVYGIVEGHNPKTFPLYRFFGQILVQPQKDAP